MDDKEFEDMYDPWVWLGELMDWFWSFATALGLIAFSAAVGLYLSGFFDWLMERAAK